MPTGAAIRMAAASSSWWQRTTSTAAAEPPAHWVTPRNFARAWHISKAEIRDADRGHARDRARRYGFPSGRGHVLHRRVQSRRDCRAAHMGEMKAAARSGAARAPEFPRAAARRKKPAKRARAARPPSPRAARWPMQSRWQARRISARSAAPSAAAFLRQWWRCLRSLPGFRRSR